MRSSRSKMSTLWPFSSRRSAAIKPIGPAPTMAKFLLFLVMDCLDGESALEHDVAVGGIAITFTHSSFERMLLHAEHRSGVHPLEVVSGRQRLELVGGERGLLAEQPKDAQQEGEESDRDVHDQGAMAFHALDRLDDVHVVDPRVAHDVVHLAFGLGFDALDDALAEIALVQRLAH